MHLGIQSKAYKKRECIMKDCGTLVDHLIEVNGFDYGEALATGYLKIVFDEFYKSMSSELQRDNRRFANADEYIRGLLSELTSHFHYKGVKLLLLCRQILRDFKEAHDETEALSRFFDDISQELPQLFDVQPLQLQMPSGDNYQPPLPPIRRAKLPPLTSRKRKASPREWR